MTHNITCSSGLVS